MNNGHEPATKQDIAELKVELKQNIAELNSELKQDVAMIRSEMQHTHDDLKETMRDIQTELLKAFYSFAESDQARLTQTERDSSGLKERIGILERRLTEVERKVNFPNHPTQ
jgi:cob(I)alamin adenosyltransferase